MTSLVDKARNYLIACEKGELAPIYDYYDLCQAVVDAEIVFRYALGPTRDVKTPKFRDWLSRYAEEEKDG